MPKSDLMSESQSDFFDSLLDPSRRPIKSKLNQIQKNLYDECEKTLKKGSNQKLVGKLKELKKQHNDSYIQNLNAEQWLTIAKQIKVLNTDKRLIFYAFAARLATDEGDHTTFIQCFSDICTFLKEEAFNSKVKTEKISSFLCKFIETVAKINFEEKVRKNIASIAKELVNTRLIDDLLDNGKLTLFENRPLAKSVEASVTMSSTSTSSITSISSISSSSSERSSSDEKQEKSLYIMANIPNDLSEHKQAKDILVKKDGDSYEIYRIPFSSSDYDMGDPISIDEKPNDDADINLKKLLDQRSASNLPHYADDLLKPVEEFINLKVKYSNLLKQYKEFHKTEVTFNDCLKNLDNKLKNIQLKKKLKIPDLMNETFFNNLKRIIAVTDNMVETLAALSEEASSKKLKGLEKSYQLYVDFFEKEYLPIICECSKYQQIMALLHIDFMERADTALNEKNDKDKLRSLFVTISQRLSRHKDFINKISEITEQLEISEPKLAEIKQIVENRVKSYNKSLPQDIEIYLSAASDKEKIKISLAGGAHILTAAHILETFKKNNEKIENLRNELENAEIQSKKIEGELREKVDNLRNELENDKIQSKKIEGELREKVKDLQTQFQLSSAAQEQENIRRTLEIENLKKEKNSELKEEQPSVKQGEDNSEDREANNHHNQFIIFVDKVCDSLSSWTTGENTEKNKLIKDLKEKINTKYFKNKKVLRSAYQAIMWPVLQRNGIGFSNKTSSGKKALSLLNDSGFKCLKECIFPDKKEGGIKYKEMMQNVVQGSLNKGESDAINIDERKIFSSRNNRSVFFQKYRKAVLPENNPNLEINSNKFLKDNFDREDFAYKKN